MLRQLLRQKTVELRAKPHRVVVAVAAIVIIIATAVLLHPAALPIVAEEKQRASEDPVPTASAKPDEEEGEGTAEVDNAVNFAKLKEENQDICAWITIPGTYVNHPVLQRSDDDTCYLERNCPGKASPYGAIFAQNMNALDFSDPCDGALLA